MTPKTDTNERNGRGQFAPGNKGGPGNPLARNVHHWRTLLMNAVSDEQFTELVTAMLRDAIAGDKDARAQLLDRLCGKPAPVEEASDAHDIRIIRMRAIPYPDGSVWEQTTDERLDPNEPGPIGLPEGAIPRKPDAVAEARP